MFIGSAVYVKDFGWSIVVQRSKQTGYDWLIEVCPHADRPLDNDTDKAIDIKTQDIYKLKKNGKIHYFEHGKHVRTEYDKSHKMHGKIHYFEYGRHFCKHVRTEYDKSHNDHGIIYYFEDGKHVRTEYDKSHNKHGIIHYFEHRKLVRTEYDKSHRLHGMIKYLMKTATSTHWIWQVARTWNDLFEDSKRTHRIHICTETMVDPVFWSGKHVRTEFDKSHILW